MNSLSLPRRIFSGSFRTPHVQGIAIDSERKYMYFSFTTVLVKTDLKGNIVGSCGGLTGHLGDITYNCEDGMVYGSLEYKSKNSFYIAIFDVEKIDRVGLDAETDGIMTAAYLKEVVDDYTADMDGDGKFDGDRAETLDHRYGCSGIDGTTFGPSFDDPTNPKRYLTVAYGIYRNNDRDDNDYQILLQYDTEELKNSAIPLSQTDFHTKGPENFHGKYFVFTGNTTYGIQNLKYDPFTGNWLMMVYNGKKPKYPNYPLYIIDGKTPAEVKPLVGQAAEESAKVLKLLEVGICHKATGICGWKFPYGQTGLIPFGDGYYYISHNGHTDDGQQNSTVRLYRWNIDSPSAPFELIH